MSINTHNLIVDFGKHKGERWTRVPASYLRWLVNQPEEIPGMEKNKDIAKAELERRGTKIGKGIVEISSHAIDSASLRVRKTWHETSNKGEGLYTWLLRIAQEAVESTNEQPEKLIYKGIKFVFKWGNEFPVLKTVMPAKHESHKN
jgi:hypothetical protein